MCQTHKGGGGGGGDGQWLCQCPAGLGCLQRVFDVQDWTVCRLGWTCAKSTPSERLLGKVGLSVDLSKVNTQITLTWQG